jgi:hypothetical protein
MSLVVAHCSIRGIKAVSDTRLFDPISRLPCSHFDGTLKIFVLSKRLGFAFAGDPTYALRALEGCQHQSQEELALSEVSRILREEAAASNGATDFLIMSTEPVACLYKVSNDAVDESDHQLWIGDPAGFEMYQRCFHDALGGFPPEYRASPDVWRNQMNGAMRSVIDSPQVATVGDFLVPVTSQDGGLHYESHATLRLSASDTQDRSAWHRTRAGTVEEGSCSITMLTSSERSIPAIGFYFFEPRFGVLFYPQKLARPEILRDLDIDSFVDRVSEGHGVRFQNYVQSY